MKKKILLFLVLLSTALIFAQNAEYTKLYQEGQKYETEENWFHAAISYMNAVNADPVNAEQAYTRLNTILNAFRNGKPGLSEYDEFSYRDLWLDIFITAEKYFAEYPPFRIVFFPLKKGALNYENKTATYNVKFLLAESDAYTVVAKAISTGAAYAVTSDWGLGNNFSWPGDSVTVSTKFKIDDSGLYFYAPENKSPKSFLIDNVPSSPSFPLKVYRINGMSSCATNPSEFKYFSGTANSTFIRSNYSLEISFVNEKGENILPKNASIKLDNTSPVELSVEGISNKYFKDIENGKIKPKVEKVTLEYGKITYSNIPRSIVEKDFINIKPENMDVIYAELPTTIKETPIFVYNECLLKLAQKGKELEQQIVKNPIAPEKIIGLTIPEKPVLTYPDIGPEPTMEPEPKGLMFWEKKSNKKQREQNYQIAINNYNLKLKQTRETAEKEYNTKLAEYEKAIKLLEEKKATDPRLKYNWYYVLLPNDVDYLPMKTEWIQPLISEPRNIDIIAAAVLNYKLITDSNNEIYIYNGDQYYSTNKITIKLSYKDTFSFFYTGTSNKLPYLSFYSSDKFCQFFEPENYNSIAYRCASPYEIYELKIPKEYPIGGGEQYPVNSEGKPCEVLIISEPIEE